MCLWNSKDLNILWDPHYFNITWGPEELKLVHYRRDKSEMLSYFNANNMSWVEEEVV
jgi:hypothetical protein